MKRHMRGTLGALLAVVAMLVTAASAPGAAGSERFDGGLVASNASGKRTVAGSVIAMSGVFTGVGRIVERPNRPGDSAKVSRDDLVFATGTLHILNVDRGHPSLAVNRRTCTATFKVPKTATVDGGTGGSPVRPAPSSARSAGRGSRAAEPTAGATSSTRHWSRSTRSRGRAR